MIKEAIGFGKTVEEAKEDAILKLGAREDEDIQIDIVSMPKKKVLGVFGGSQAEVRVYVERPDAKKPVKKNKPAKAADKAKAPEKSKKDNKPSSDKKPAVKKAEAPANKKSEEFPEAVDAAAIDPQSKTGKAIVYLNDILDKLGCENVVIKAAEKDNAALIILEGEGLGVIIGHRGETLDALQHLVSLAANNGGGYFKVTLNIGNFREKREQTLISLATRVSAQVIRNGRSRALEPMNPYERRIIHTTVQDIDGVVSSSTGEGSSRRVVISPEGGATSTRGDSRNRQRRSGSKPSAKVVPTADREPKRDSDIPLYGKIETASKE